MTSLDLFFRAGFPQPQQRQRQSVFSEPDTSSFQSSTPGSPSADYFAEYRAHFSPDDECSSLLLGDDFLDARPSAVAALQPLPFEEQLLALPSTSLAAPTPLPPASAVASEATSLLSASTPAAGAAASRPAHAAGASADGAAVTSPVPRFVLPPCPPAAGGLVESVRSLPQWVQRLEIIRCLSGWAAYDRQHLAHLSDYARLDARLKLLGLGRKYTRLDGNCMCHAIEDQCAPGRDDARFSLRLEAVRWLREHSDDKVLNGSSYADLVGEAASRERHCKRLGNVRDLDRIEFGDQYLLVAAAHVRQRNVVVIMDAVHTFFQPIVVARDRPWIFLALHDNCHYESLVPLESAAADGLVLVSGDPKQRMRRKRATAGGTGGRTTPTIYTVDDDPLFDDGPDDDDDPAPRRRRRDASKAGGGSKKKARKTAAGGAHKESAAPTARQQHQQQPQGEQQQQQQQGGVLYVDAVLDMKLSLEPADRRHLRPLYLVRWSGYDDAANTWEPRESFESLYRIEEFYLRCTDSTGQLPYVPSAQLIDVPRLSAPTPLPTHPTLPTLLPPTPSPLDAEAAAWRAVLETEQHLLHENAYARVDAGEVCIGGWCSSAAGAQLWAGLFRDQQQFWFCFKGSEPTRYVVVKFADVLALRYGRCSTSSAVASGGGSLLPASSPGAAAPARSAPHPSEQLTLIDRQIEARHGAAQPLAPPAGAGALSDASCVVSTVVARPPLAAVTSASATPVGAVTASIVSGFSHSSNISVSGAVQQQPPHPQHPQHPQLQQHRQHQPPEHHPQQQWSVPALVSPAPAASTAAAAAGLSSVTASFATAAGFTSSSRAAPGAAGSASSSSPSSSSSSPSSSRQPSMAWLEFEARSFECYVHRVGKSTLSPVPPFEGLSGERSIVRHRLVAAVPELRRLIIAMFMSSYRLHALAGASSLLPPPSLVDL